MAKDYAKGAGIDAKVTIKQIHFTGGGVATPVEGFASDAGMGKPPVPREYGARGTEDIPTKGKTGGGNSRALNAYFGKGKRGTP
jgi:hypothetical protein